MKSETGAQGPGSDEVVPTTGSKITRLYGRRPQVWRLDPPCPDNRRRYQAELRLDPLEDGQRDPDRGRHHDYELVETLCFGLTPEQVEIERERLVRLGWSRFEADYALTRARRYANG